MYLDLFSLNQYCLPPLRTENLQTINKILSHHFNVSQPGVLLRIEHRSEVIAEEAFGMASVELETPIECHHIFQANALKPLLGTLITLMLEESGQLRLDDSISKFIPDWPANEITIEHLLRHNSGIPEPDSHPNHTNMSQDHVSKLDQLNKLKGQFLNFRPGTQWELSSSNNFLIERIIEILEGESFFTVIAQKIFKTLKMSDSFFVRADHVFPDKVPGYKSSGSEMRLAIPNNELCLYTSSADLSRLFQAMQEGSLLSESSWRNIIQTFKTHRNANSKFGMNCFIHEDRLYRSLQINNKADGFEFHISYIPEHQLTIYLVTNCDSNIMTPAHIANLVCDQLLAEEPVDKVDTVNGEEYTGTYNFVSSGKVEIYCDESELKVRTADGESFRLRPLAKDVFIMAGSELRFWFSRNNSGDISSLEIRHRQLVPQEQPALKSD